MSAIWNHHRPICLQYGVHSEQAGYRNLVSSSTDNSGDGTLGRIALKQVRVSRQELEARQASQTERGGSAAQASAKGKGQNPMNRLVPYLDLFCRLEDEELSRLARVPTSVVSSLRAQVDDICNALDSYSDLLPRLRDEEFVRLTGASAKTVQFWRLCQPRLEATIKRRAAAAAEADETDGDRAAPAPSDSVVGAVDELGAEDSGSGLSPADRSGLHDLEESVREEPPAEGTARKAATPVADGDEFDAAFEEITEADTEPVGG